MADYFSKSKHDLSITDPSTADVIGFACDRVEGKPAYAEYDGKSFVDLFSTNPTQTSTNPEEELILGQSTYHAGFGKEYFDSLDPKRYFSSIGCDLRSPNMAIAGWTSAACTKPSTPSAPTIANTDFEIDVSPTSGYGWTAGQGSWAQSALEDHTTGTGYSWLEETIAIGDNLHQTLTGFVKGCTYVVQFWVKGSAANDTMKVGIYDGATETFGGAAGGTSWHQITHTRTLSVTASALRIKVQCAVAGTGANMFVDDASITVTALTIGTTPPYCHATFNDKEYAAFGAVLGVMTSGTTFSLVTVMPAAISCLEPFQVSGTDYLMIGQGTSADYFYMTTAEAFTQTTGNIQQMQYFSWVNTTVDTLYANDGGNSIYSTTDPTGAATWGANLIVGDAANIITRMVEKGGALLIDKEDMPYYLDSTPTVKKDLAEECRGGTATHSGKNSTIWGGEYFRPTGDQALLVSGKYTDGSIGRNNWIEPASFTTNNSNFSGQVEAVAGDEKYLYCAVDDGSDVQILAGRYEIVDGVSSWRWHPIHKLTLAGVNTMWISNVVAKRLYISSTTAGNDLKYLPLPTEYANIISDSARVFLSTSYFITPWYHGDFKSTDKALIKVEATLGHAHNAGIYWECWMQTLGETSWATDMGDLVGSATTRKAELFRTTSTTSTMFRFKFVAITDDTDKTPVLLDFKVKALLHPDAKKVIFAKVRVKRDSVGLGGLTSGQMYEKQKTCITNCKDAVWVVTIKEYVTDKHGVTHYVKFLPLPQSMEALEVTNKEVGKDGELEYNLLMLDVPQA